MSENEKKYPETHKEDRPAAVTRPLYGGPRPVVNPEDRPAAVSKLLYGGPRPVNPSEEQAQGKPSEPETVFGRVYAGPNYNRRTDNTAEKNPPKRVKFTKMKPCSSCGFKLEKGWSFCPKCGSPIAKNDE